MYSGGIASWAAAKRVVAKHGIENVVLLFCDTLMEDEDLYRFLHESAANVGVQVTTIADGRNPWEVFRDERFVGNSRVDPCSKILKRQIADRWMKDRFTPDTCVRYVGIDYSEEHRYKNLCVRLHPWRVEAPLLEDPPMDKDDMRRWAESEGLEVPRLYQYGFPHNNCGGFCVKSGQSQFKRLLETMPERYAYHEQQEQELREHLGRDDVAIMRDRAGGTTKPLTMKAFRLRVEQGLSCEMFDWGGCGCFVDD